MKVNCLSCGHKIDLGDAYDNYAGQVKCLVCGAVLAIRTEGGELKSVGLARQAASVTPATVPDAAPVTGDAGSRAS